MQLYNLCSECNSTACSACTQMRSGGNNPCVHMHVSEQHIAEVLQHVEMFNKSVKSKWMVLCYKKKMENNCKTV